MKILVIEPVERMAAIVRAINAEVTCVADEIRALKFAQQQPGLILLDYALRGEQTPEYIRFLLDAAGSAKLAVTGSDLDEDQIISCMLAGANGYQDARQLPDYIGRLVPAVINGEAWLSRKLVARLLDVIRQQLEMQEISS